MYPVSARFNGRKLAVSFVHLSVHFALVSWCSGVKGGRFGEKRRQGGAYFEDVVCERERLAVGKIRGLKA